MLLHLWEGICAEAVFMKKSVHLVFTLSEYDLGSRIMEQLTHFSRFTEIKDSVKTKSFLFRIPTRRIAFCLFATTKYYPQDFCCLNQDWARTPNLKITSAYGVCVCVWGGGGGGGGGNINKQKLKNNPKNLKVCRKNQIKNYHSVWREVAGGKGGKCLMAAARRVVQRWVLKFEI